MILVSSEKLPAGYVPEFVVMLTGRAVFLVCWKCHGLSETADSRDVA